MGSFHQALCTATCQRPDILNKLLLGFSPWRG
jgi:hypothetical protein